MRFKYNTELMNIQEVNYLKIMNSYSQKSNITTGRLSAQKKAIYSSKNDYSNQSVTNIADNSENKNTWIYRPKYPVKVY